MEISTSSFEITSTKSVDIINHLVAIPVKVRKRRSAIKRCRAARLLDSGMSHTTATIADGAGKPVVDRVDEEGTWVFNTQYKHRPQPTPSPATIALKKGHKDQSARSLAPDHVDRARRETN